MIIQFTRDFRSAATREEFYPAGAIVDLDRGSEIVAEGAAIAYVAPEAVLLDDEGQPVPVPPGDLAQDLAAAATPSDDEPKKAEKPKK